MAPHRTSSLDSESSNTTDSYQYVSSDTSSPLPGSEPIAIIGIGTRLPGGVNSSSKLWELLKHERSGQCKIPTSRFNVDAFYHPNGVDRPGSMNTEGGYFLQEDEKGFDNEFFGINPMEATYMDPQQRKLLEVVFESFESAGVALDRVSGSNTGCYVGNFTVDFQVMQTRDSEYLHRYSATGMGTTILGNRISHAFNLQGPSLVLDTACSSSLYCLHVACTALENRECDAAVVAGANLIQSPEQHLGTMKAGVLSSTSTCHTFSDEADGYGRADGIGSLFIKRLSDAIRDNDPVRAVIRGTAINSNGKTPGITLPSAVGQEAVIRKAYAKAGLDFDQTAYVECHGTGTPVGDPIEAEALSRVFNQPGRESLLIGSIKSNLGHSEAASGISGVVKTVLSLEHGKIPATLGVRNVNPKIKTEEWNIEVVTKLTDWPTTFAVRRAGINSFGYGGANAHAILESAEGHVPQGYRQQSVDSERPSNRSRSYILPFSATNTNSLQARVTDIAQHSALADIDISDLAYTLGNRRSHFPQRGFVIGNRDNLHETLTVDSLRTLPSAPQSSPSRYAFIFTGQGAQWPQMCKELMYEIPIFRNCIVEMDAVLQTLPHPPSWTLRESILEGPESSKIHDVTRSQPTCTAIQVALVQLLYSWDIKPSVVVGHSSGEIAAAFAAGLITSAQAITSAYYRGYVVGRHVSDGAMMAAGLSAEAANSEIDKVGLQQQIRVACINSPESVTISGDASAIDKMLSELQRQGIFARKLNTGGRAYHSHHMLAFGEEYQTLLERSLSRLGPASKLPADAQWISSVTGKPISSAVNPTYWRANLESPVLFVDALERLTKTNDVHFIEIGPHSALEMPIKQTKAKLEIGEDKMPYSTAITRGKNGVECVLGLAGRLYLHGISVSFDKVNGMTLPGKTQPEYKVLHDLPPYKWTYDRILWNEPRSSLEFRQRRYKRHELLGSQVPGGNGLEVSWRNILRVSDVSWLQDHKLQETVVFPGAGYVAMAIEAVIQATEQTVADKPTLRLRHVHILTALALSTEPTAEVELFTSLKPTPITSSANSNDWWDFSIVSFRDKISTTHATGSINIRNQAPAIQRRFETSTQTLEPTAPRVWYDKLIKEGLNFGRAFQSIREFQVPRKKDARYCTTRVPLLHKWEGDIDDVVPYVIHPITIDAMLQTAIVATSAGVTRDLRAKVPVVIDSAVFRMAESPSDDSWYVHSQADVVGFGAAEINAELGDKTGRVVAQLKKVRLAPYDAAAQTGNTEKRHPMLRVLWKPDAYGLGLLSYDQLTTYLERFVAEAHSDIDDEGLLKLGAALYLLSHKNPRMRILELGNEVGEITLAALSLLHADTSFKRFSSYTVGHLSDEGGLVGAAVDFEKGRPKDQKNLQSVTEGDFDLVLLPFAGTADTLLAKIPLIKKALAPNGLLLASSPSTGGLHSADHGFSAVQSNLKNGNGRIILAQSTKECRLQTQAGVVVVDRGVTRLSRALRNQLEAVTGQNVRRLSFNEVSQTAIPAGTTVFCLLESEKPLLSSISDDEMSRLKTITNNASSLVWVTGGNLMKGGNPDFGLVSGLSRALMLEQPSLSFFTFDIDKTDFQPQKTVSNIIAVLTQSPNVVKDYEFVQSDGLVHVSRFVPDAALNESFREKQGDDTLEISLCDAKPAQLTIDRVGHFDTIYFKQDSHSDIIEPRDVKVEVKAVGVNAKDLYVLGGKVDTRDGTSTLEYSGVIEQIGSAVTKFEPGDRVVVMAPSFFKTSEIVPEWACEKLEPDEDFNTMCTLSVVYATALYALHNRARISPGETVLIHSGAGGVGIAAIQIAQQAGAIIFATVSTEAKKEYLIKAFDLDPANIFNSRDSSFLSGVLDATDGRGVDVVLNSLVGDLLHASWRCCAPFGRFIEIGKRDLTDAGKLEMEQFLKSVTFSAFDMSHLYFHENPASQRMWNQLLARTLELYRAKKIRKIEPLEVFDISDVTKALRHFSSGTRMGKVAINFENPASVLKVQPHRYKTLLSPAKSYIMIGCLGGLGRSMSKWMMTRGARRFVFLGRSGLDKVAARRLVEDLESSGADCRVIRGDVCNMSDIKQVVDRADGPIGGVVQAAMGLNEALFTTMSNHHWHTGIDPKVLGTWNLHNAIKAKDQELDFFLMTSSISGSVGTATESNYCSGNYFLDMFARFRRSLGLPAMSVGLGMISEVGYLHENPEIEALLLRKGIQAINEDELLQIIDVALSSQPTIPHAYDAFAHNHILTGLEPLGLKELRKKGFEGESPTLNDPRASVLAGSLEGDLSIQRQDENLPAEVVKAIEDGKPLSDAVLHHIMKRFSNLVLIPLEKVDATKALAAYGMDSMIAAEFRTWFFQTFKVDIPFLELLSKTVTISSLSETVFMEMDAGE